MQRQGSYMNAWKIIISWGGGLRFSEINPPPFRNFRNLPTYNVLCVQCSDFSAIVDDLLSGYSLGKHKSLDFYGKGVNLFTDNVTLNNIVRGSDILFFGNLYIPSATECTPLGPRQYPPPPFRGSEKFYQRQKTKGGPLCFYFRGSEIFWEEKSKGEHIIFWWRYKKIPPGPVKVTR